MFERKTNNPLLVKAAIGRSKPITTKLPPTDFVYGKIYNNDDPDNMKKSPRVKWPRAGGQESARNYS